MYCFQIVGSEKLPLEQPALSHAQLTNVLVHFSANRFNFTIASGIQLFASRRTAEQVGGAVQDVGEVLRRRKLLLGTSVASQQPFAAVCANRRQWLRRGCNIVVVEKESPFPLMKFV